MVSSVRLLPIASCCLHSCLFLSLVVGLLLCVEAAAKLCCGSPGVEMGRTLLSSRLVSVVSVLGVGLHSFVKAFPICYVK